MLYEVLYLCKRDILRGFDSLKPYYVVAELCLYNTACLAHLCELECRRLVLRQERSLRMKTYLAARHLGIGVDGILLCEVGEILTGLKLVSNLFRLVLRFQEDVARVDLTVFPEFLLVGLVVLLQVFVGNVGSRGQFLLKKRFYDELFLDLGQPVLKFLVLLDITLRRFRKKELFYDQPVEIRLLAALGSNHHLHVHGYLIEFFVKLGHGDLVVIYGDQYLTILFFVARKET